MPNQLRGVGVVWRGRRGAPGVVSPVQTTLAWASKQAYMQCQGKPRGRRLHDVSGCRAATELGPRASRGTHSVLHSLETTVERAAQGAHTQHSC